MLWNPSESIRRANVNVYAVTYQKKTKKYVYKGVILWSAPKKALFKSTKKKSTMIW